MSAFNLEAGKRSLRIPAEVMALFPALHMRAPDTTELIGLSDAQWMSLLSFCDIAHLTLQMAQLPSEGFPQWVIDRLRTNLADNALRFERVKATYREAAAALDQAGVEHIVIKGFTQAPDYVANPQLRAQSDIDIFCPPKSLGAARMALQAIGYGTSQDKASHTFADHDAILTRSRDWRWKGNPFDPEMPLGIELHFCLWNERVSQVRDPGTALFWERRAMRTLDGFSFSCLSPADHLAYLTLHILRNLFLGEWIVHHVHELAVFLKFGNHFRRSEFKRRRKCRLRAGLGALGDEFFFFNLIRSGGAGGGFRFKGRLRPLCPMPGERLTGEQPAAVPRQGRFNQR